ncbi:hypothetical protein LCGC14_0403860 [marine sediment metagenome]|uniref:Uncharacterized protein n=1 Tax=marine sediment metagenome TaxID=412755 RepID=A0A0F9TDT2_9ZZZZ
MSIIEVILILVFGILILTGVGVLIEKWEERDNMKRMKIKYPPDHPFWGVVKDAENDRI